jgi:hypothetical protein
MLSAAGGAAHPVRAASLGSGIAGQAPVAGHGPQAAGQHDHKARHSDRDDISHDPGEQQPDADQQPERRPDEAALVMHPRVGRADGLSKPRVTGAERLLDLLKLALLVLRQ